MVATSILSMMLLITALSILFVVKRTICLLMTTMQTLRELLPLLQVRQKKLLLLCLSYMKADSTDVLPENLWIVQLCYRNLLIWELIIFLLSMPMTHELTMLFLFTVLSQLCQHISSLKIF